MRKCTWSMPQFWVVEGKCWFKIGVGQSLSWLKLKISTRHLFYSNLGISLEHRIRPIIEEVKDHHSRRHLICDTPVGFEAGSKQAFFNDISKLKVAHRIAFHLDFATACSCRCLLWSELKIYRNIQGRSLRIMILNIVFVTFSRTSNIWHHRTQM